MPLEYTGDDPSVSVETILANQRHDRAYGWSYESPTCYLNPFRNKENQVGVPHSWLARCKDEEDVRQAIWNWHNRHQIENEFVPEIP